ncbi:hypothetical protein [Paenibacillus polymyxa]|uniref:hypothetical protein n=1 Tax=Paenibacillus polymyxa TaxID=1406 RepID=UPI0020251778|nr:hypothetical protein [Paenibacillus polymyxa]WDZ59511.1 hypothetical protein MF626_07835 [Paenibacillus polymyxa]
MRVWVDGKYLNEVEKNRFKFFLTTPDIWSNNLMGGVTQSLVAHISDKIGQYQLLILAQAITTMDFKRHFGKSLMK